ncbi:hypothetical protein AYO44_02475 [Planctomycetaceae bacterium SCGC AG-212-F19]|nr:hypothetical protein AYO44_02475 [Planctomycetaceae bacterium SCGC AG-212-F19]
MSFVHPLLLGGLLLVGLPVLIHLIMQQKPKRLSFPAFRFLAQKVRTNQRRLRLRHLLLLLLRMGLIALMCLALARPKIFNERINLGGFQPVAVALVVDTSMSMEYKEGGKSRLDEAKRRATELVDDLPDGSRIAVFDTAEIASGEWIATTQLVRERIGGLQLRSANGPVTDGIASAYRLMHSLDEEQDQRGDPMPRFLYVFSDRTEASWDPSRLPHLTELRDRGKTKVLSAYVDVGVAKPVDLAITELKLPQQLIPANGRFIVHATIRATGQDAPDLEVRCRIDGEKDPARELVKLRAGESTQVTFKRLGLPIGLHQAEITLATSDTLPFNNARFVTFEVTKPRKVLVLADEPQDAEWWRLALKAGERVGEPSFDCDVRPIRDARELTPADLAVYQAVCLLSVAAPDKDLWEKLERYVAAGGGLAIIPGGEDPARYNDDPARELMPGKLGKLVSVPADKGVRWDEGSYRFAVKSWFEEWKKQVDPPIDFIRIAPTALRYWDVAVEAGDKSSNILATYADTEKRPALVERRRERGRVVLFTTAFDRTLGPNWNDYLTSSFYVALIKKSVGYLSGDALDASMNHLCRPGQPVLVSLPPEGRFPNYVLDGPGLTGQAGLIARAESQNELKLNQAVSAGNYTVVDTGNKWRTGFSVNVPPEESNLNQVPPEQIEALLGPKAVLPVGHNINFRDALQGHWSQPVELLPYLMIGLLLFLAVENLLANKFYRRPAQDTPGAEPT